MVSNIDKLSSLIHFLSTAGFTSESSELTKLAGGALPIPQKMYDMGAEHIRYTTALGIKKMFEDIPSKLAKVEALFERTMKLGGFFITGLKEFDALSDDQKAGQNSWSDGGQDYVDLETLYLGSQHIDRDRFEEEYSCSLATEICVSYHSESKQYSFYSQDKFLHLNSEETFKLGIKSTFLENILDWHQSKVDRWSEAITRLINDTKSNLAVIDGLEYPTQLLHPYNQLVVSEVAGGDMSLSPINSARTFRGWSLASIPMDLEGYKNFKPGVKYPKILQLTVEFFDTEKGGPKEGSGDDDMRWGYFQRGVSYNVTDSATGETKLEQDAPRIKIGIPQYTLYIQYLGSPGNLIDRVITAYHDSFATLGHELTHFGQYIIDLNAALPGNNFTKPLKTGKLPRGADRWIKTKEESQYDRSGILKTKLKLRLSPKGKMEWSIYSPKHHNYFWFGEKKPSGETIREISSKNEDGGGARLGHEFRDVEQKTRLYDELIRFKKKIADLPPQAHKAAFKKFVGSGGNVSAGGKSGETVNSILGHSRYVEIVPSYWLGELKANEPQKWKQVVLAMYQELSKDPDVKFDE